MVQNLYQKSLECEIYSLNNSYNTGLLNCSSNFLNKAKEIFKSDDG